MSDEADDVSKAMAAFGIPKLRYHSFDQAAPRPSGTVQPRRALSRGLTQPAETAPQATPPPVIPPVAPRPPPAPPRAPPAPAQATQLQPPQPPGPAATSAPCTLPELFAFLAQRPGPSSS